MRMYDVYETDDEQIKRIETYLYQEDFTYENMSRRSQAAAQLYDWFHAVKADYELLQKYKNNGDPTQLQHEAVEVFDEAAQKEQEDWDKKLRSSKRSSIKSRNSIKSQSHSPSRSSRRSIARSSPSASRAEKDDPFSAAKEQVETPLKVEKVEVNVDIIDDCPAPATAAPSEADKMTPRVTSPKVIFDNP